MFLITNLEENLFWDDKRNWVEREKAHEYGFVSDLPYRLVSDEEVEKKDWNSAFNNAPIRYHSKDREFQHPRTKAVLAKAVLAKDV